MKETVRYYRQHLSAGSYNCIVSQSHNPTLKGVYACVFSMHTIGGTVLYSGQHNRLFTNRTSTIIAQCFCSANSCQHQGRYFQRGIVWCILHIQKGFERLILTFPTECMSFGLTNTSPRGTFSSLILDKVPCISGPGKCSGVTDESIKVTQIQSFSLHLHTFNTVQHLWYKIQPREQQRQCVNSHYNRPQSTATIWSSSDCNTAWNI